MMPEDFSFSGKLRMLLLWEEQNIRQIEKIAEK